MSNWMPNTFATTHGYAYPGQYAGMSGAGTASAQSYGQWSPQAAQNTTPQTPWPAATDVYNRTPAYPSGQQTLPNWPQAPAEPPVAPAPPNPEAPQREATAAPEPTPSPSQPIYRRRGMSRTMRERLYTLGFVVGGVAVLAGCLWKWGGPAFNSVRKFFNNPEKVAKASAEAFEPVIRRIIKEEAKPILNEALATHYTPEKVAEAIAPKLKEVVAEHFTPVQIAEALRPQTQPVLAQFTPERVAEAFKPTVEHGVTVAMDRVVPEGSSLIGSLFRRKPKALGTPETLGEIAKKTVLQKLFPRWFKPATPRA